MSNQNAVKVELISLSSGQRGIRYEGLIYAKSFADDQLLDSGGFFLGAHWRFNVTCSTAS